MAQTQVLLEELRKIQEDGETGLLFLMREGREINVCCREGMIDAVSSNMEEHTLGQYLVKDGFIKPSDLGALLKEAQRQKISLGEALIQKKLLDTAELSDVVRRQAIDLLKHALEHGFTLHGFTTSVPDVFIPAQINFEHLLLELARSNPKPFDLDPDKLIFLNNGRDLSHLPWYPQELSVLSELNYPRTLQGLSATTGLGFVRLTKILNVFQNLRLLQVVEGEPAGVKEETTTAIVKRSQFPFEHLIPEVSNAVYNEKLEILKNETSFISEQFKSLKVRLNEAQSETPIKAITISSPFAQDGKSLISANLAFSFAKDQGRRVIILDCDLRNPSLDKLLGVPLEPGLIGYLENERLQPYCFMRRLKNLYILTAGGSASEPVELLSLDKMRELIEYLKTEFDTILIDAPPYAPISDARILAGLSDGLVVVIRRGRTSYGSIERAFKLIDRKKLLGVVFNDVKPMLFHTHYDYGYYRYGYHSLYPYSHTRKTRHPRNKTYLED